jgi:DNA polymerase III alpha subunit (gram-positive type)
MRLIAVDLELNQLNNSPKIIQIGAVCFEPHSGLVVDIFDQFINPNEPITKQIVELTGIDDTDVENSPNIVKGAQYFNEFKVKHQANPIGIVWGSGRSNDIYKIFDESGVESAFSNRIIDVKAIFNVLANSSSAKYRQKVGLGKALELLELNWDFKYGAAHNALADAYNTMRLYIFLSKCLKGGVDIKLG